MIIMSIIFSILSYLQNRLEVSIKSKMELELMKGAFSHALKVKSYYLKNFSLIKVMNDAFYDIQQILSIAESSFLTIFITAFKTIGACIALFYLNWKLSFCILLIIPVKLLFNTILKNKTFLYSLKLKDVNKTYNAWFEDVVNGALDIRLWNLNQQTEDEYEEFINKNITYDMRKQLLHKKYNETTDAVESVALHSIYIIGAYFIATGELTIGQLLSFITFSTYLLMPIDVFLHLRIILKGIEPSLQSYREFLDLEEENLVDGIMLDDITIEKIKFKEVSLKIDHYTILKDISFEIKKGEKVAFIGENGSGKSSCLGLLERLIEPTEGQIQINDIDISSFNLVSYRNNLSIVNQIVHLFNKSIEKNVLLSSFENTMQEKDNKLFDFVEKLPQGWGTSIGVEGNKLSGGEKQKIALIRALQKNAKILILDEPTSAYDTESKELFANWLRKENKSQICILVTHDESVLNLVDKIIEFKDGKITLIKMERD